MKTFLDSYLGIIRKFIPHRAESSSMGLDIGSSECKLIEIQKAGSSFEIVNSVVEPIQNSDIKKSVQSLFSRLENPAQALYTSLYGKGTLIRYIEMPRMSLDDLRKSFAIESDKYFPFPQEQIYTDCYILNPQAKSSKMSVLVAAAKKNLVDQRLKLLKDLQIDVEYIGIDPVVLINTFNFIRPMEGKINAGTTAILDMGESVSNLILITHQIPQFTRDIYIGGSDFTRRISSAFGFNFPEAEQLKYQPKEKMKEVLAACESAIMNIVQEIKLSFDYFTTEKNSEISELLLVGGGSAFEGLAELLEKNLEVKVERWNPLSALKISSNIEKNVIEKNASKLGTALGLALAQYD